MNAFLEGMPGGQGLVGTPTLGAMPAMPGAMPARWRKPMWNKQHYMASQRANNPQRTGAQMQAIAQRRVGERRTWNKAHPMPWNRAHPMPPASAPYIPPQPQPQPGGGRPWSYDNPKFLGRPMQETHPLYRPPGSYGGGQPY